MFPKMYCSIFFNFIFNTFLTLFCIFVISLSCSPYLFQHCTNIHKTILFRIRFNFLHTFSIFDFCFLLLFNFFAILFSTFNISTLYKYTQFYLQYFVTGFTHFLSWLSASFLLLFNFLQFKYFKHWNFHHWLLCINISKMLKNYYAVK